MDYPNWTISNFMENSICFKSVSSIVCRQLQKEWLNVEKEVLY